MCDTRDISQELIFFETPYVARAISIERWKELSPEGFFHSVAPRPARFTIFFVRSHAGEMMLVRSLGVAKLCKHFYFIIISWTIFWKNMNIF